MTRMRRSLYSLAAMYLNTGLLLVSGLVATPLLVIYLGDLRIGIARTAFEYLNYITLLALGVDGMLNVHFAKASADGDRTTIIAALRAGLRAYARVALLSLLWIVMLIVFAPVLFGLVDDTETLTQDLRIALTEELRFALFVAMLGPLTTALSVFRPLIEAEQRGYRAHLANAAGTAVALSASILFAYLGFGLPGQLLSLVLSPMVNGGILAFDVLRRYPEVLARKGPRLEGVQVFNPTVLLVSFFSRLSFMSDCIIVSLVLGAAPVAGFTLSQRLMALLFQVVNSLGNSTWASLVNLYHTGEMETFHRRSLQLTRATAMLAVAILIPAAVWNGPFVRAWTSKPDLFAGETLSLLTACSLTLFSVVTLWSMPLVVTGRFRQLLPLQFAGGMTSLATGVLATHFLGVIGPPIGTLVNLVFVGTWWMARLLETEFGTRALDLIKAEAGPLLLGVPYYGALYLVAGQFSVDDLAASRAIRMGIVAALIGVSAAIYIAITLTVIFPTSDRDEFLKRFRRRKAA